MIKLNTLKINNSIEIKILRFKVNKLVLIKPHKKLNYLNFKDDYI